MFRLRRRGDDGGGQRLRPRTDGGQGLGAVALLLQVLRAPVGAQLRQVGRREIGRGASGSVEGRRDVEGLSREIRTDGPPGVGVGEVGWGAGPGTAQGVRGGA